MDEMIFLPSRVHEDDMPSKVIIINHDWQHLNLPLLVDDPLPTVDETDREAYIAWFHKTWACRLQTDEEPVIIVSRIYEEGEGKNE